MTQNGVHMICEKCSRTFRRERTIMGPQSAYSYLRAMANAKTERLVALYLSVAGWPIQRKTISIGTLANTPAHPREILGPAIRCNAYQYVIAHNHPSGNLEPSQEDILMTQNLREASDLMGIYLVDHLIVSRNGYTSLKERGVI